MLKGAIIGFGKIAETAHMPAFLSREIAGNVEISSIVDISAERKNACRNLLPHIRTYYNLEDLFRNEQLDFIDICVPPNLHAEPIEAALENNVNIICEKPFTNEIISAQRLYEKIKSSDVIFISCHQYKYSPVWQKFKEIINNIGNEYKPFIQFNIFRMHADNGYDSINPGWRSESTISGGGILADTGYHYFYLILQMLGKPLNIIPFTQKVYHKSYNSEDTALITIECERGIAQINLSWAGNSRVNHASIISPACSAFYNGNEIEITEHNKKMKFKVPDMSDKVNYIKLYEILFNEFIRKLIKKSYGDFKSSDNFKDLEEAYQSMLLLDNCYRNDSQKIVNFNVVE